MLNRQRELTLPRLTAAPTATSSAYVLTLQFLWRQAFCVTWGTAVCETARGPVLSQSRVLVLTARTLNAIGCSRVTLSLR